MSRLALLATPQAPPAARAAAPFPSSQPHQHPLEPARAQPHWACGHQDRTWPGQALPTSPSSSDTRPGCHHWGPACPALGLAEAGPAEPPLSARSPRAPSPPSCCCGRSGRTHRAPHSHARAAHPPDNCPGTCSGSWVMEGACSGWATGTAVLQAALLPCPAWKAPLRNWEPMLPWHLACPHQHPAMSSATPACPHQHPGTCCCVPTQPCDSGHSNHHLPTHWGEPAPSEEHPHQHPQTCTGYPQYDHQHPHTC